MVQWTIFEQCQSQLDLNEFVDPFQDSGLDLRGLKMRFHVSFCWLGIRINCFTKETNFRMNSRFERKPRTTSIVLLTNHWSLLPFGLFVRFAFNTLFGWWMTSLFGESFLFEITIGINQTLCRRDAVILRFEFGTNVYVLKFEEVVD